MFDIVTEMFETIGRHRSARKALDAQSLRIKALRLRDSEPFKVPVEFKTDSFWTRISSQLGHGVMFARTSYQTDTEAAVACHWEEGAMLHRHCHPDTDKYIYIIRGALKDLEAGAVLYPGERISVEEVLQGTAHAQPYEIKAGTVHFLQALEPDTFFVIKFVRKDANSNNSQ